MILELPDPDTIDIDGPVVFRGWPGPEETTFVLVHGLGGSHLNWIQVAPGLSGLGRVAGAGRCAGRPEAFVALGLRLPTGDPGRSPAAVVALQVDLIRDTMDDPEQPRSFIAAARSVMSFVRNPSVSARVMDSIRCPVLVIHGRRDRFVPARFVEVALSAHPAWRGRILPGVGHVPQMERPDRWLGE